MLLGGGGAVVNSLGKKTHPMLFLQSQGPLGHGSSRSGSELGADLSAWLAKIAAWLSGSTALSQAVDITTCIVDTHVTQSRYTWQYHHLPSPLHTGKAPPTFPSGDENVFHALTRLPLTLCFFLGPGLFPTASTATSSMSLHPALSPVLHHMSYCLTVFVSASVAYMLCLVTSLPSATCHHAGKEDSIKKEACEPGTTRSIAASTSICIENSSCIIATTSSIGRESCETHRSHHIVAGLAIRSCLEACLSGRVKGWIQKRDRAFQG